MCHSLGRCENTLRELTFKLVVIFFLNIYLFIFIYLAALGLSCGTWDLCCGMWDLHCGMRDLYAVSLVVACGI